MSDKNKDALDLDKLEALARAATPGPWKYNGEHYNDNGGRYTEVEAESETIFGEYGGPEMKDSNFIAAFNPAAVLQLIALARRASQVSAAAPADASVVVKAAEQFERFFALSEKLDVAYIADSLRTTAGVPTKHDGFDPGRASDGQAQTSAAVELPKGHVVVPDYRGFANLGIGAYVLNNSEAGEIPELIISIATDEEKSGRVVGEKRANKPGYLIEPEAMAVRIRFSSLAGLEVLEGQLRELRAEHFPDAAAQLADSTAPGAPDQALRDFESKFRASQVPMDPECAAILSKANLFDLYAGDDAAPTAQQSLTAGGAVRSEQEVCDLLREKSLLTAKGLGSVLNGDFVSLNITAITAIVNAAAPLPQVQSEALDADRAPHCSWAEATAGGIFEEGSNTYKQYAHLFQDDPRYQADKAAYLKARGDQQLVTPSGALADNDGGVA